MRVRYGYGYVNTQKNLNLRYYTYVTSSRYVSNMFPAEQKTNASNMFPAAEDVGTMIAFTKCKTRNQYRLILLTYTKFMYLSLSNTSSQVERSKSINSFSNYFSPQTTLAGYINYILYHLLQS